MKDDGHTHDDVGDERPFDPFEIDPAEHSAWKVWFPALVVMLADIVRLPLLGDEEQMRWFCPALAADDALRVPYSEIVVAKLPLLYLLALAFFVRSRPGQLVALTGLAVAVMQTGQTLVLTARCVLWWSIESNPVGLDDPFSIFAILVSLAWCRWYWRVALAYRCAVRRDAATTLRPRSEST
ncbi:MAG: hypothetical protein R3F34_06570 [Planctomycetota bacterium]